MTSSKQPKQKKVNTPSQELNAPKGECCEKCRAREHFFEKDEKGVSHFAPTFCINKSCPCHKKAEPQKPVEGIAYTKGEKGDPAVIKIIKAKMPKWFCCENGDFGETHDCKKRADSQWEAVGGLPPECEWIKMHTWNCHLPHENCPLKETAPITTTTEPPKEAVHKVGECGAIGFDTPTGIICAECGKKQEAVGGAEDLAKEFSKRFDRKFVAMMKGETQWGISNEICAFISTKTKEAKQEAWQKCKYHNEEVNAEIITQTILSERKAEREELLGEIKEWAEKAQPSIGVLAAIKFSPEANEYVSGYRKALSDLLALLESKKG